MTKIAIIGGSGLDRLGALTKIREHRLSTRYGSPSAAIIEGTLGGRAVMFLPRHGEAHTIPPHRINYRANIAALRDCGVDEIFAVTAVGGIADAASPGRIVVPSQIVDYTYGREQTFYDGLDGHLDHVEFGEPYTASTRHRLIAAASAELDILTDGVYGATQGPRLESAAEIACLARDGCTIVGMTGMPEAALAREAGLRYANCALVVNWAAGIGSDPISLADIEHHLRAGMTQVVSLLSAALGP